MPVTRSHRIEIGCSLDRAFPLFTPKGEEDWVEVGAAFDERIKLQVLTRALPPADRAERAKLMSVLIRCE